MKTLVNIVIVILAPLALIVVQAQTVRSMHEAFAVEFELLTSHEPATRAEYRAGIASAKPGVGIAVPTYDEKTALPILTGNQVMLLPDHHGRRAPLVALERLMKSGAVDWLAIEMFNNENQADINAFLRARTEAEAFVALQAVFRRAPIGWVNYWGGDTTLETDPYIQILRVAKELGIRVIAMEENSYRPDFGAGRTDRMGITFRNQYWVRKIPRSGRGLVFGGALHFLATSNKNVQNFLVERGQSDLLAYDFGLAKTLKANNGDKLIIRHRAAPARTTCAELWR